MSEPRSVEAVVADESDGPPLPNDGSAPPKDFPAWARLEDQIRWYDSHSLHNQHWFKGLKLVQILVAAAIPVAAGGPGLPGARRLGLASGGRDAER